MSTLSEMKKRKNGEHTQLEIFKGGLIMCLESREEFGAAILSCALSLCRWYVELQVATPHGFVEQRDNWAGCEFSSTPAYL